MKKSKPLTEEQWLSESPIDLLEYLQHHRRVAKAVGGKRRLRLLCVGMCRSFWHLISNEDCRRIIETGERAADSNASRAEVRTEVDAARALINATQNRIGLFSDRGIRNSRSNPELAALVATIPMARLAAYSAWPQGSLHGLPTESLCSLLIQSGEVESLQIENGEVVLSDQPKRNAAIRFLADLIRDIFGNPFRPVTLDPRWLTSTVLDLARTIYDERTFERMPILADALMDAGCDCEEIIKHCQGPGPHVRGCWVVDLLLGKE